MYGFIPCEGPPQKNPGCLGIQVRCPEDGLLVATTHAGSLKFAGKETHVPKSSRPRYEQLSELLKGSRATVDDVKKALSDHTGGVCTHEKPCWTRIRDYLISGESFG